MKASESQATFSTCRRLFFELEKQRLANTKSIIMENEKVFAMPSGKSYLLFLGAGHEVKLKKSGSGNVMEAAA